jgi:hypothetical protein
MRRSTSNRWLVVGTTAATVGGALAVAYWIYVLQAGSRATFWRSPGYVGIGVLMIGIVCLIAGWFAPDSASDSGQVQRGGAGSTNLQAGRDIRVDIRRRGG